MSVHTYRKKPVTIEATQWTGKNVDEIQAWVGVGNGGPIVGMPLFVELEDPKIEGLWAPGDIEQWLNNGATTLLFVAANSAWLPVEISEWIARDRHGFYPIKDDVFLESYEKVDKCDIVGP